MALFIFRRDLRLADNIGLLASLASDKPIYPIFIFNPEQINPSQNPFFSHNSVQFMCESLEDLRTQTEDKFTFLHGHNVDVLTFLLSPQSPVPIEEVHFNMDYSGYSQRRDAVLAKLVLEAGKRCYMHEDIGLFPMNTVTTSGGKGYNKFTPFYTKLSAKPVPKPELNVTKIKSRLKAIPHCQYTFVPSRLNTLYKPNKDILVHGGRRLGLAILDKLRQTVGHYQQTHDQPMYATTHLSAYLKYGCVSAREAYHAMRDHLPPSASRPLIRQLFWREFYLGIAYQYPDMMLKRTPQKPSYAAIKWSGSDAHFQRWCEAKTGYPIVDAAMREMAVTGYMHNRCRLIVSGFLIKTLLVDWRKGEQFFAQSLVDYDFANNNGGWQWSAGSGTDSQPYFRIFNPWAQSAKFDSEGLYIKRWLPELNDVAVKDLHQWDVAHDKYPALKGKYPAPIVDYAEQKQKALAMYRKI